MQEQNRKERTLTAATKCEQAIVLEHFEWAKKTEIHA